MARARQRERTGLVFIMLLAASVLAAGCSFLDSEEQSVDLQQGSLDGDVERAYAAYNTCLDSPSTFSVFLQVGASAEQIDGTAAALASSPNVESSRYVDDDETYDRFKEQFSDEPEIIDLVEPGQLPTSFDVETSSPDFATVDGPGLLALDGVDGVEPESGGEDCLAEQTALSTKCDESGFEQWPTAIWVWLPATSEEATDVTTLLDRSEITLTTTYRTGEETLAAMATELDANLSDIEPAELLPSYIVAIRPDTDFVEVDELMVDLEALETVEDVGLGWNSTTDICTMTAYRKCLAEPDPQNGVELLIWMEPGVAATEIDAVRAELDSLGGAAEYRYIGIAETYESFARHFRDEPEVLDLVERDKLPTTFEVSLTPEAVNSLSDTPEGYASSELEPLDGVDEVEFLFCAAERDAAWQQCLGQHPLAAIARPEQHQRFCSGGVPVR